MEKMHNLIHSAINTIIRFILSISLLRFRIAHYIGCSSENQIRYTTSIASTAIPT